MPTLSPPLLIVIGILTTAVAQVLLKRESAFDIRTSTWITWRGAEYRLVCAVVHRTFPDPERRCVGPGLSSHSL